MWDGDTVPSDGMSVGVETIQRANHKGYSPQQESAHFAEGAIISTTGARLSRGSSYISAGTQAGGGGQH